jgi:hypothetical protein
MIGGDEFSFILEDHDLVLRISKFLISPVVYGYFRCLGAIFCWNMEDATSRHVLVATQAALSNMGGVVNIGVGGDRTSAKPCVACARVPRKRTDEKGHRHGGVVTFRSTLQIWQLND